MTDIPTIRLEDLRCRNCDQLDKKRGLCILQQLSKKKDDIACSQIFDHYNKEE